METIEILSQEICESEKRFKIAIDIHEKLPTIMGMRLSNKIREILKENLKGAKEWEVESVKPTEKDEQIKVFKKKWKGKVGLAIEADEPSFKTLFYGVCDESKQTKLNKDNWKRIKKAAGEGFSAEENCWPAFINFLNEYRNDGNKEFYGKLIDEKDLEKVASHYADSLLELKNKVEKLLDEIAS